MDNVSIVVHQRDATGTRVAKRLRKAGLIPGVIYGHGKDAVLVSADPRTLRDALSSSAGTHAVLDVTLEGQKGGHKAIVKDLALDPVKQTVIHFDLQEIRLDKTIETSVAVHFEGEAKGVKAGGMLDEAMREVTIKGLVTAIPEHFMLDISELDMNEAFRVSDLTVPDGIEVLDALDEVLCSVLPPRKTEGVEGAEAEAEAGGAAEPEVVGKAQKEEGAES